MCVCMCCVVGLDTVGVSVYIKQQAHASQSTLLNCDEALCVASRIWFRILSVLCRVCGCCGKAPVCRNVPRCSGVDPFHISNGTINYIVNYINN